MKASAPPVGLPEHNAGDSVDSADACNAYLFEAFPAARCQSRGHEAETVAGGVERGPAQAHGETFEASVPAFRLMLEPFDSFAPCGVVIAVFNEIYAHCRGIS